MLIFNLLKEKKFLKHALQRYKKGDENHHS